VDNSKHNLDLKPLEELKEAVKPMKTKALDLVEKGFHPKEAMLQVGYSKATASQWKKTMAATMASPDFQKKIAPIISETGRIVGEALSNLTAEKIAASDTRTLVDIVERFTKLPMILSGMPTARTELSLKYASEDELKRIIDVAVQETSPMDAEPLEV